MSTVLISTLGTRGDVAPFLWLAKALGNAGIRPLLLLSPLDAARAKARGLEAVSVGPEVDIIQRCVDDPQYHGWQNGPKLVRDFLLPFSPPLFEATKEAIAREDPAAIVSHFICCGSAWAAEEMGVPSVLVFPSPFPLHSRDKFRGYPVWMRMVAWMLGPPLVRSIRAMLDKTAQEVGRRATAPNPFAEAVTKPQKIIGMWSPLFRPKTSGQPRKLALTGFPAPPAGEGGEVPEELERFLADGPAPIAVGLGSAVIHVAGKLLGRAARAARRTGRHVVVFADPGAVERADNVLSVPAAPYDKVFPRCAAVVIHGGIGTAAAALRAGVPTVVVPYGVDQFDNAIRLKSMGVGTWKLGWTSERGLARALHRALKEDVRSRAAECGRAIRAEGDGTERAAEIIASLVRSHGSVELG